MKNIIVIGGGASGMMAAIAASANGAKVTIIEQNAFPGKKYFPPGTVAATIPILSRPHLVTAQMIRNFPGRSSGSSTSKRP